MLPLPVMPKKSTSIATSFLLTLFLIIIYIGLYSKPTIDSFTFEVTPEKKCCGGLYMLQNDPEATEYCKNLPKEVLDYYCCGTGFNGAPVHYEYTPESNSKWENKRCNCDNCNDCDNCNSFANGVL